MKEKAIRAAKLIAPIPLSAWFPYRFYRDIAHYCGHSEDILTPFVGFFCILFCAMKVYKAVKNHEWISVGLYGFAALSALVL